jgi:hypothetical protein
MRADGRTDMMKLIVAFRNFEKALNKTDDETGMVPFSRFHNQTYFFYDSCKVNHKPMNGRMATDILPECVSVNTVGPGYNDIGLCGTSSISSDILWYQLIAQS